MRPRYAGCRTQESSIRRGQAEGMGRLGQSRGEPGLHARCGACPAWGICELVVRYNSGLQLRTTCWCPALSRGWVVQPEPYAALCQAAWQLRQGRSAEYGVLHRCGPVELLCRRVQVTRIARPKQTELGLYSGATAAQGACPGHPRELHPLGIGLGGSGRVARAAGPTDKENLALPFLRRKDLGRNRHRLWLTKELK